SSVIPFRSAKLLLVERDGQPFVPMKPVVEGMGLAWQSQHRKLQSGRFATCITEMVIQLPGDTQRRPVSCLPLRKLTGWLMSIHPNKVRPELREGIIAYQNECDDVLWAYWNEGAAVRRDDRTVASVLATTIGTDGFHCLAAVVDGKVRHLPSAIRRGAKNHIWSQVHKAFSVVTAEDIPADQLDSARNFIAAYALEGEWLPKDKAASAVDTCSWSNIAFLVDCVEKCWKIVESRRLATHLSGLGCNAGVELAGFLWDGLG
ncbi:phage antirepressor N-terminal domain-containing protein, partial [Pseudomonas aeruginosa]